MNHHSRQSGRRSYTSETDETCSRCKNPIKAGEHFWRGLTKEPSHKACVRFHIVPAKPRVVRPPYCSVCNYQLDLDDPESIVGDWHWVCLHSTRGGAERVAAIMSA
jgi:hypothetical protein